MVAQSKRPNQPNTAPLLHNTTSRHACHEHIAWVGRVVQVDHHSFAELHTLHPSSVGHVHHDICAVRRARGPLTHLLLLPNAEVSTCGSDFPALMLIRPQMVWCFASGAQLDCEFVINHRYIKVIYSLFDDNIASAVDAISLSAAHVDDLVSR